MLAGKFLGVGLTKALSLAIFTMLVIVATKVIMAKHPIAGVSEVIASV